MDMASPVRVSIQGFVPFLLNRLENGPTGCPDLYVNTISNYLIFFQVKIQHNRCLNKIEVIIQLEFLFAILDSYQFSDFFFQSCF